MSTSHRFMALDYFEMLLFAIILNLNAVRIVMGNTGEILTYSVFFAFVAFVILDSFINNKGVLHVYKLAGLVLLVFLLSCYLTAFRTNNSYSKILKLISGLLIAFFSSTLSNKKRLGSIYISLFISGLYSIYIILNTQKLIAYVSQRVFNYMDATLPLGLGLTFLLSIISLSKLSKKKTVLVIFMIVIHAYAMIQLFARGNLLFPIVIAVVLLIYKNRTSVKKTAFSIVAAVILLVASYFIVVKYANERLLRRLTNLFVNFGEEDRIGIYLYYIKYILHNFAYVFGVGFRASAEVLREGGFTVSYPHNFVLELVGELGLVGIFTIGAFGIMLYRNIAMQYGFFRNNKQTDDAQEQMLFYLTLSGFLFYFLSFLKSYSIYDGYQFFIFISLIIHPDRRWLSAYKNAAQV